MRRLVPVVQGLLIVAAGLLPWTLLTDVNGKNRPDLPWAPVVTLVYLAVLLFWLHGFGPPRRTSQARRQRLRLWPPGRTGHESPSIPTGAIVVMLVLLYVAWVAISRMSPIPDLAEFPTTASRWSAFLMGGIMSGVVEEVAYRGYMQTGLERIDQGNAVMITSAVFALSHITQGIGALLLMGPGLFLAGVLYGMLARQTGTILPGMVIHVSGDLGRTFFGVLHGDGSLLFVR